MEKSGGGGAGDSTIQQPDIFDDANPNPTWVYYLTHVLQVVYLAGFVASSILFVNAYVVHTHFFPGAPNNDLYSDRGTSLWWWVLCFSTMRFLFFLCMQWMFTFRNTMCCNQRYPGCTIFWMVLMVLLLSVDIVGLVANSYYLATCNGLDAFGNPCNAAGWCCLPDVRVRPGNHCPNQFSSSCPVIPEISKNGTFLGIFSINVVFVALELYFVLLPLILWVVNFRSIPRAAAVASSIKQASYLPPPQPQPSAPPAAANQDDVEPELQNADSPTAPSKESMGMTTRIRGSVSTVIPDTVVLRRPGLIPQTPLLAAAKSGTASGLISHVTPTTEKNTKQP